MRQWLLVLVLLSSACRNRGDFFDLKFKGTVPARGAVDIDLKSDDDGATPSGDSLPFMDGRDIAPWLVTTGDVDGSSTVSGKCLTDKCSPKGVVVTQTPPPIIYAGPWAKGQAVVKFEDSLNTGEGAFDFTAGNSDFTMTFDPPEYKDSSDTVMVQTGKVTGVYGASGAAVAVSGTFSLNYTCTIQNLTYRSCGQEHLADGMSNPIHRPYTENTCPAELVQPYEASPTWTDDTLHLGGISIPCRETNSSHTDNTAKKLLCYRRATMSGGGCDWDVHFLTDGQLQQFAVAAFAKPGCSAPVKTCNTYR